MKKRTIIIVLTAALAVSQTVCIFAASSLGTGPVIVDSNSDGSSYDIGERADRAKGGASGSTAVSSGQGNNAVQIAVGQTAGEQAVGTNSRGQAVIGDTALEFVQGTTLLLPVCRSQWWMLSMALTADALSVKPCREWT